ncbi:MFS transporter [Gryllotalpicola kribbensis]|uniref:MFS transporter n=1 Tax=Gryllotalpicola kribbensis TaxID=993084 RepID=A0ABP8AK61_9MICO
MSDGSAAESPAPAPTLRAVFAGPRGRLLIALLIGEFGGAVQGIAYSTVLPLAACDLHGSALYGATLAAATLSSIFMLALGPAPLERLGFSAAIGIATVLFAIGAALSALAPDMVWILIGNVIRGLSMGIIAGLGYAALGSLYEDALRPRVFGLFAFMWLVPSLVGPLVNAGIASAVGWRWAMVWPAVLVIGGRVLMWRSAAIIPRQRSGARVSPLIGFGVVGALVLASWTSSEQGPWAWLGYLVGLCAAVGLSLLLIVRASGGARRRVFALTAFFGSCVVYFAAESVMPLAVVGGLGGSVLAGGLVVGAAGVGWSLLGLVPVRGVPGQGRLFGRAPMGVMLVGLGMIALALAVLSRSATIGVPVAVAAGAVIGVGMGMAYTVQSAANFNDLEPTRVSAVATAAAFAETGSITVGSLLTGGSYSLATSAGAHAASTLATGFLVLAALAVVVTALTTAALRRPDRVVP